MPHCNPLIFPTLGMAGLLFAWGRWIARQPHGKGWLAAWTALTFAAATPALLFAAYYTHLFDHAGWFYAFRALPLTELTAAGIGLGAGLLAELIRRSTNRSRWAAVSRYSPSIAAVGMALILAVPYVKPIIAPLRTPPHDQWREGVCLQNTPATCGPACAATLLRQFGRNGSERELARECFSYAGGTENWYVARAIRQRGLHAEYLLSEPQPDRIPFPAIAGVGLSTGGRVGHFIAILEQQEGRYVVADPLIGKLLLTPNDLRSRYYFTGFFLVVRAPSEGQISFAQDPP